MIILSYITLEQLGLATSGVLSNSPKVSAVITTIKFDSWKDNIAKVEVPGVLGHSLVMISSLPEYEALYKECGIRCVE